MFSFVVEFGNRHFAVFSVVCCRVMIQHYQIALCGGQVVRQPNNRFFDGKFIPEAKTIHWTCNKAKYARAKAKTSEYFEGKHNFVRSKEHVLKTRNCIAMKIILPFHRF